METADQLLFALTLIAALGCGLMAGLFFAFSVAVMKALARLPSCGNVSVRRFQDHESLRPQSSNRLQSCAKCRFPQAAPAPVHLSHNGSY